MSQSAFQRAVSFVPAIALAATAFAGAANAQSLTEGCYPKATVDEAIKTEKMAPIVYSNLGTDMMYLRSVKLYVTRSGSAGYIVQGESPINGNAANDKQSCILDVVRNVKPTPPGHAYPEGLALKSGDGKSTINFNKAFEQGGKIDFIASPVAKDGSTINKTLVILSNDTDASIIAVSPSGYGKSTYNLANYAFTQYTKGFVNSQLAISTADAPKVSTGTAMAANLTAQRQP